jgi:hypothetical protein
MTKYGLLIRPAVYPIKPDTERTKEMVLIKTPAMPSDFPKALCSSSRRDGPPRPDISVVFSDIVPPTLFSVGYCVSLPQEWKSLESEIPEVGNIILYTALIGGRKGNEMTGKTSRGLTITPAVWIRAPGVLDIH